MQAGCQGRSLWHGAGSLRVFTYNLLKIVAIFIVAFNFYGVECVQQAGSDLAADMEKKQENRKREGSMASPGRMSSKTVNEQFRP
jgi:hypothetical protein